MRIRWTLPAARDLESIKSYLGTHHPHRVLYDEIRSLKSMPGRGRMGLKEGTREILFPPLPYIVVYRLSGDAVEILRIYHGAQNRTEL